MHLTDPTAVAIVIYLVSLSIILALLRVNRHIDAVAKGAGRAGEVYAQERRVQQAIDQGWEFDHGD